MMLAKTARQEAKQEQIRTAARDLFLRHGYADTSMDAVTAAAGVSKQTLYRYYETKAALFADVLSGLVARPASAEEASPATMVPRSAQEFQDLLVGVCQRYLDRMMEPHQLALLRVIIAEGSRFPEITESFRATLPAAGASEVMAAIEAGNAAGLVAGWIETRTAARALAGLLLIFIVRDGLLAADPKLPSQERLVDTVRIFMLGISRRPAGA